MTARPRRQRWEPDARREQILSCAVRLFGERGYEEVSTAEVAAAAGVVRGLVNHYFGTKKELYLDVVRVLVTIPDDVLDLTRRGDLAGRVDSAVTWFLDAVARHARPWLTAIGASGAGTGPDVAEVIAEADEATIDAILRVAHDPDGGGPPPPPGAGSAELRAALRAYVSFARSGAVEWLVRGSLSREQAHTLLAQTLVTLLSETVPTLADGRSDPSTDPAGPTDPLGPRLRPPRPASSARPGWPADWRPPHARADPRRRPPPRP